MGSSDLKPISPKYLEQPGPATGISYPRRRAWQSLICRSEAQVVTLALQLAWGRGGQPCGTEAFTCGI